jgi:uncharacterized protein YprB with RNaseH-like and TPR domain
MDFKAKLARLNRPGRPDGTGFRLVEEPSSGAVVADAKEAVLAGLRRKMADILSKLPEERPRIEPAIVELPFCVLETPSGPLHSRVERLAPSHHVGRIPVSAAVAARAEALALLSLDPRLATAEPSGALFLDTETTGLGGGAGTVAFVVGLASFDGDVLVVEQLLLRTPGEEQPLLERVAERMAAASMLVTYNGKSFDLPLLRGRYVMNRLPEPPDRPHLDLLHVGRRIHKSRIGACSLKALESEVLGFVRDTDIDGGDVAPRYGHFLRTGDESVLRAVVDHNAWDVVSMAALLGLYGEPLETLHCEDLLGLARTYRRAKALEEAVRVADVAVVRGAGPEALRVRGEIAKARGDRARALADFEELSNVVDDPAVRLELAKLYEHFVKAPGRALELVNRGTAEPDAAAERRRARLERKAGTGRSDP